MKISPYRTGEPRFGKRDPKEKVHGDVIEYTLSPEELEEYRNRPKREQIKITKPIKLPMGKKKHGAIR